MGASMNDTHPQSLLAQELTLVDDAGRKRISLSARQAQPSIELFTKEGRPALSLSLEDSGLAAIRLGNLSDSAPTAVLEVVDSGAHVKLTGVGKAASYLFLNNAGGSGVVLIDTAGVRRLVALAPRRRQHSN